MVIDKLKSMLEATETALASQGYSDRELAMLRHKQEALKELLDFGCSGVWLTSRSTRERFLYFLKWGRKETARAYKLDEHAMKNMLYYANTKLEKYISMDMLAALDEGWVGAVMLQFHTRCGKVSTADYLLSGVNEHLTAQSEVTLLNLGDNCEKELQFLKDYSVQGMLRRLKDLNPEVLGSLVYILNSGETDFLKYRQAIAKLFGESDVPVAMVAEALKTL